MGLLSFNRGGQALIYGPAQAQTPYGIPQALAAPDMGDDETSTGKKKSTLDKGKESEYLPGYTRDEMKWGMLLESKQNALMANAMNEIKEDYGNRIEAWAADKGVQYQRDISELNDEIINYEASKDAMKQQTDIWVNQSGKIKDMQANNQYVFDEYGNPKINELTGIPYTQTEWMSYSAEQVARTHEQINPLTGEATGIIQASQPNYPPPFQYGSFDKKLNIELNMAKTAWEKSGGPTYAGITTVKGSNGIEIAQFAEKAWEGGDNYTAIKTWENNFFSNLKTDRDAYLEAKDGFLKQYYSNNLENDLGFVDGIGLIRKQKEEMLKKEKPDYTDDDLKLTKEEIFRAYIYGKAVNRGSEVMANESYETLQLKNLPDEAYGNYGLNLKTPNLTRAQLVTDINYILTTGEQREYVLPEAGDWLGDWENIPTTKQGWEVEAGTAVLPYFSRIATNQNKLIGDKDRPLTLGDISDHGIGQSVIINKDLIDKYKIPVINIDKKIYVLPKYTTDSHGFKSAVPEGLYDNGKPVYDPQTGKQSQAYQVYNKMTINVTDRDLLSEMSSDFAIILKASRGPSAAMSSPTEALKKMGVRETEKGYEMDIYTEVPTDFYGGEGTNEQVGEQINAIIAKKAKDYIEGNEDVDIQNIINSSSY